jgi:hypothetical protein
MMQYGDTRFLEDGIAPGYIAEDEASGRPRTVGTNLPKYTSHHPPFRKPNLMNYDPISYNDEATEVDDDQN